MVTELDLATATTAPVASVTTLLASFSSWNLLEPSLALTRLAMVSWAVLAAISWLATIISSNFPLPSTTLHSIVND